VSGVAGRPGPAGSADDEPSGGIDELLRSAGVDDAAIAALNRRFRRARGPTDVLAFPYGEDADGVAGEIIVSAETAARAARGAGAVVRVARAAAAAEEITNGLPGLRALRERTTTPAADLAPAIAAPSVVARCRRRRVRVVRRVGVAAAAAADRAIAGAPPPPPGDPGWAAQCQIVRAGERAVLAEVQAFVAQLLADGPTRPRAVWQAIVDRGDPAATGAARLLRGYAQAQLARRA